MPLTFSLDDIDEVGLGQTRRVLEYGSCDRDRVVPRETAYRFDRRIAERRKSRRQLGTRLPLHAVDQAGEHEIEQLDMILIEAARPVEKKRCHALEGLGLPLWGPASDDIVQLWKEEGVQGHRRVRNRTTSGKNT